VTAAVGVAPSKSLLNDHSVLTSSSAASYGYRGERPIPWWLPNQFRDLDDKVLGADLASADADHVVQPAGNCGTANRRTWIYVLPRDHLVGGPRVR
jgi:hypothetical protein